MQYALIPVKDLDGAKTRLGDALDGPARRQLVVAMYRDVLAAAVACAALDGVFVVSRDPDVLALAEAEGATGLAEPGGLNESLTAAAKRLGSQGAERLLVLFADVPLADAAVIERVLESSADVALVASADGGTNALALTPGGIDFHYGPGSAAKHVTAAERAGLTVERLDEPSLALDIDTIDDLEALRLSEGVGAHTRAVLDTALTVAKP